MFACDLEVLLLQAVLLHVDVLQARELLLHAVNLQVHLDVLLKEVPLPVTVEHLVVHLQEALLRVDLKDPELQAALHQELTLLVLLDLQLLLHLPDVVEFWFKV